VLVLKYIPYLVNVKNLYPVYKPGKDKHSIDGYRDVYNSCIFIKLIDKILTNDILIHLHERGYRFLNHAYLKNNSQQNCLLHFVLLVNSWYRLQYLFHKNNIFFIKIDFSAAFMSMDINTLILIFRELEITETIIEFIKVYFIGFWYVIKIKGEYSLLRRKQGCTPGACLVSLLFCLYTDWVYRKLGIGDRVVPWSDDGIILMPVSSKLSKKMQSAEVLDFLKKFKIELATYGLRVNLSKTEILAFRSRCVGFNAGLLDKVFVDSFKFLGVWFDYKFRFDKHKNKLLQKMNLNLILLQSFKTSICSMRGNEIRGLVNNFFLSHIRYCVCIWYWSLSSGDVLQISQAVKKLFSQFLGRHTECIYYLHDIWDVESIVHIESLKLYSLLLRLNSGYSVFDLSRQLFGFDIDEEEKDFCPDIVWKGLRRIFDVNTSYCNYDLNVVESELDETHRLKFHATHVREYFDSYIDIPQWSILFEQERNLLNIFTDASCQHNPYIDRRGYGLLSMGSCAFCNGIEIPDFRFSEWISNSGIIIYGEAIAIMEAVLFLFDNFHVVANCGAHTINIVSDSLTVLKMIRRVAFSIDQLLNAIIDYIVNVVLQICAKYHYKIQFFHVKAHQFDDVAIRDGNKFADELAKSACVLRKDVFDIDCSGWGNIKKYLKHKVFMRMRERRETYWARKYGETQRSCYNPVVYKSFVELLSNVLCLSDMRLYYDVIFGRVPTNEVKYRFQNSDTDLCDACHVCDSQEHWFSICKKFLGPRQILKKLFADLNIVVMLDVVCCIENVAAIQGILRYYKATIL
jgi:hypothetical protein